MTDPFKSTDAVKDSLSKQKYIASNEIATIVYRSRLGKPLLTEGRRHKTELAKVSPGRRP
jgi:hypothetical protein